MFHAHREFFDKEYYRLQAFLVNGMMSDEESDTDDAGDEVLICKRPLYRSDKVSKYTVSFLIVCLTN
jgi:hypothetical protein